tara:strand:- start:5932 stop:6348 length:417 start_codon:yes stop_codon:yes gene_type:complete
MGILSLGKKIVGGALSIGKKVAKGVAGAALVGGAIAYGIGHKEAAHPKNNPPPLPDIKPNKPYDKKVVNKPAPEGFIHKVGESGKLELHKASDVAQQQMIGPELPPEMAAQHAADSIKPKGVKQKLKKKLPNPFKKKK